MYYISLQGIYCTVKKTITWLKLGSLRLQTNNRWIKQQRILDLEHQSFNVDFWENRIKACCSSLVWLPASDHESFSRVHLQTRELRDIITLLVPAHPVLNTTSEPILLTAYNQRVLMHKQLHFRFVFCLQISCSQEWVFWFGCGLLSSELRLVCRWMNTCQKARKGKFHLSLSK